MIYLDNAATTFPKPSCVVNSMIYAQRTVGANAGRGGHAKSVEAGEIVFSARDKLGRMFSCDSENVIFTLNCTMSLNMAIKGVLKSGDHVIISSLEHNSVARPIHKLKEKGVSYSVFRVYASDDEKTLENLKSLYRKNTKAVVCTAVSNVFGTVLPIQKIGEFCKEKGILFILDAAQAAGSLELDMEKMHIDILCVPGHKGLLGPMGTGVLLFKNNINADTLIEGGTGSFSMEIEQPVAFPDRFESGTVNLPGIAGLSAGVSFIEKVGIRAIEQKEAYLIEALKEDLSVIENVIIYSDMHTKTGSNLLSFNISGVHSERLSMALDEKGIALRGGYHCAYLAHKNHGTENSGAVRASVGYFNCKNDIKNLVFWLNKFAKERNL